jgi:hypothetical protein
MAKKGSAAKALAKPPAAALAPAAIGRTSGVRKRDRKPTRLRKKRESVLWVHSGDTIYWVFGDIKNTGVYAADYANFDSAVQLWIKAKRKSTAIALAKRWLKEDDWQLIGSLSATKADAGLARLASMLDPTLLSDEEADEWVEHFRIADTQGLDYEFGHYVKSKRKRK